MNKNAIPLKDLIVCYPDAEKAQQRWDALRANASPDARYFSVPGRIEIIGNHTDHNHGKVLAASINLDIIAAATGQTYNAITVHTLNSTLQIPLNRELPGRSKNSAFLIKSILIQLTRAGYTISPVKIWLDSEIPIGKGLSSSAAFCMLIIEILIAFSTKGPSQEQSTTDSLLEKAVIAQEAEHENNKPCGLMDQLSCTHGGIIAIDFAEEKRPAIQPSFPMPSLRPVIVYSRGGHENLDAEYAAIPAEMQAVSNYFSQASLRHVDVSDFYQQMRRLRRDLSDRAIMRAIHFFAENERVERLSRALEDGNEHEICSIIAASGDSSWKLLQNVILEDSLRQDIALIQSYSQYFFKRENICAACRVHGGGFTGSVLAMIPNASFKSYRQYMQNCFGSDCITDINIRPIGACELLLDR